MSCKYIIIIFVVWLWVPSIGRRAATRRGRRSDTDPGRSLDTHILLSLSNMDFVIDVASKDPLCKKIKTY